MRPEVGATKVTFISETPSSQGDLSRPFRPHSIDIFDPRSVHPFGESWLEAAFCVTPITRVHYGAAGRLLFPHLGLSDEAVEVRRRAGRDEAYPSESIYRCAPGVVDAVDVGVNEGELKWTSILRYIAGELLSANADV